MDGCVFGIMFSDKYSRSSPRLIFQRYVPLTRGLILHASTSAALTSSAVLAP